MSISLEEDQRIKRQERKNVRYYNSLAKWYEPYDRNGKPLRKNIPKTLAEFRKNRRKRRERT